VLLTDLRKLAPCVGFAGRVRGIHIQKIISNGSRDITERVHGVLSNVPLIFGRSGKPVPLYKLHGEFEECIYSQSLPLEVEIQLKR